MGIVMAKDAMPSPSRGDRPHLYAEAALMRPGRIGRPLLELVRKHANGDMPCIDCEPRD